MNRSKSLQLTITLVLTLAQLGCGYFNTLYNANRQFADAERARVRGDIATARINYLGSIEKAAKSYRKYPSGRWSDDALYLIARARFELGEYLPARAAFTELLSKTRNHDMRARAHAYAGAAAAELASPTAALIHLDSALSALETNTALAGFAHRARAKVFASLGDMERAWQDLDAVSDAGNANYTAVQFERLALSIAQGDSSRARRAFARILANDNVRLDSLSAFVARAAARFGPSAARSMLAIDDIALPAPAHDTLALVRAQIALQMRDTLAAHRELLQLSQRAALPIASVARVAIARSRLLHLTRPEQLLELRPLLLPAIANADAQNLVRAIRLVDVLIQRSAQTGQPLGLFAAAEAARDQLGAPLLARQLFVTYVDLAPATPWAGKALLAAIAVEPDGIEANALRSRLNTLPPNPYTSVIRGESAEEAFETAEERLSRSMIALLAEASQLAQQQEGAVTRAISVLDSIKLAARADTARIRCGVTVDTLALTGVRADSVRAACLRGDNELMLAHLKIDTLMWKPTARDSIAKLRGRRAAPAKRDTIIK